MTSVAKIIEVGAPVARAWHSDDEAELTVIMSSCAAAERGEIPTIRVGRLLRVPVRAMERLLDQPCLDFATTEPKEGSR
jgi:hypothetical protein